MSIIRTYHDKKNPYVMINKLSLWDENLSFEAVGLWARLLSRPDNWHISAAELASSCGCNIKKIYRLLNELIENGYAYRYQINEDGSFKKYETYVFEHKMNEDQIKEILPLGTFPLSGNALSAKRDATKEEVTKERETKERKYIKEKIPEPERKSYGKFVRFTDDEYKKCVDLYGEDLLNKYIQKINDHCTNNRPKGYTCYLAALRTFHGNNDLKKEMIPKDNKKLVEDAIKENPIIKDKVDVYSSYVEIKSGPSTAYVIDFKEKGFIEQFNNSLRKIGLTIKWLK